MEPIVIVVSAPTLLIACIALALPYVAIGVRAVWPRRVGDVPERHGLREIGR